jgi:hypothetical protein
VSYGLAIQEIQRSPVVTWSLMDRVILSGIFCKRKDPVSMKYEVTTQDIE